MNLSSSFLNSSKISYLQVPAVRSSTAELCDVWKVSPFACFEPLNCWFYLMIPNSCIRIDHKKSFSTYCLCAALLLLCLSILIFSFLSWKVLISLAVSHLEAVSYLWWLLLLSLDFFHFHFIFFETERPDCAQLSRCRQVMNLCSGIKHQNRCSLFCSLIIPTVSFAFLTISEFSQSNLL